MLAALPPRRVLPLIPLVPLHLIMSRKNPEESSSSSGEPEWRLAGKSHLVKADAMSSTKVVRDFEDSLAAVTGTSMIGTEKANKVLLIPADKAKEERRAAAKAMAIAAAQKVAEQITQKREKIAAEKAEKVAAEKAEKVAAEKAEKIAAEEAQWAKEAEEVQKKRKKGSSAPKPVGSSAPKPVGSNAPKPVGSNAPRPLGSSTPKPVDIDAAEPSGGSKVPETKKMPNPPKEKAMPVPRGSVAVLRPVRKVHLKPRKPGVPNQVFRQLAEKKLHRKKQGYLARTIARAMRQSAGDSPRRHQSAGHGRNTSASTRPGSWKWRPILSS